MFNCFACTCCAWDEKRISCIMYVPLRLRQDGMKGYWNVMCTAVTLQSLQSETFLGRTMDFSHNIAPGLYVLGKNHIWNNILNGKQMSDYYSFIGIGQESNGLLGFFDGMNERGFGAAALYFAGHRLGFRAKSRFPPSIFCTSYWVNAVPSAIWKGCCRMFPSWGTRTLSQGQ